MALVTYQEVSDALNLGDDLTHIDEVEGYIAAADEYVSNRFGAMPSATFTEWLPALTDRVGLRLMLSHWPVINVLSITDASDVAYTYDPEDEDDINEFTVAPDGYSITHPHLGYGSWTVVYTAGFTEVPADLKVAALEDIRGLFQPGQVGPPAAFGAFGIEATDTGPTFRPVRLWPRIDAWIAGRTGPNIA